MTSIHIKLLAQIKREEAAKAEARIREIVREEINADKRR